MAIIATITHASGSFHIDHTRQCGVPCFRRGRGFYSFLRYPMLLSRLAQSTRSRSLLLSRPRSLLVTSTRAVDANSPIPAVDAVAVATSSPPAVDSVCVTVPASPVDAVAVSTPVPASDTSRDVHAAIPAVDAVAASTFMVRRGRGLHGSFARQHFLFDSDIASFRQRCLVLYPPSCKPVVVVIVVIATFLLSWLLSWLIWFSVVIVVVLVSGRRHTT